MEESISFEFWKIVSYSAKLIERYGRFGATSGCRRIQARNLTSRDGLSCAVSVQHTFCWALWAVCHFWRKCLLVRHTLCSLCPSLLLSNSLSVSSSPLCPISSPHLHHLPSLIFHASFSLSPPEPPVFLSSVILACVSLSTSPCTFKSMCYSSLSLMPSVCAAYYHSSVSVHRSFQFFYPPCQRWRAQTPVFSLATHSSFKACDPHSFSASLLCACTLASEPPPSSVLCTVPLVCHC